MQKNNRKTIRKVPGTNTVDVDGECLEYKSLARYVVYNQKTNRYAMLLSHSGNAYLHVQPIRKNGTLSQSNAFWIHEDNWYYVGTIQYCTALRPVQPPEGGLAKFFLSAALSLLWFHVFVKREMDGMKELFGLMIKKVKAECRKFNIQYPVFSLRSLHNLMIVYKLC